MHLFDFNDRIATGPDEAEWESLWNGLVHATLPCLGRDAGTRCHEYAFGDHGVLTNFTAASAYRCTDGMHALVFDGSDDRISHANVAERIAGSTQITISAWLWRAAAGNGMTFGWENSDPNRAVMIVGNGILYCAVSAGNSTYNAASIPGNGAGWHHAAIVYDGSASTNAAAGRCYWDGIDINASGSSTTGTVPTAANLGTLTQGNSSVRGASNGRYAECLIHNRVLTPQEIWQLARGPGQLVLPKRRRLTWYDAPPEPIEGDLAVTLDDAAPTAAGSAAVEGDLAIALDDASLTSAASAPVNAGMSATLEISTVDTEGAQPEPPDNPFHVGFGTGFGYGVITVNGELELTLDDAAATIAGVVSSEGELTPALESAALNAAASASISAALSQTTEAALASASSAAVAGAVAITLDDVTHEVVGYQPGFDAAVDVTLDDAAFSAAGSAAVVAAMAVSLEDAFAVVASAPVSGGNVAVLQDATGTLTANPTVNAALAIALDAAGFAASGATGYEADLAVTLDAATLSASASAAVAGSLAATPTASLSAPASAPVSGQFSATLDDATFESNGLQPPPNGNVEVTLDDATVSATGAAPAAAALDTTVAVEPGGLTGNPTVNGACAIALDSVAWSFSGTPDAEGVVAATLDDATLESAGGTPFEADFDVTLEGAVPSITAATSVSAAAAITLEAAGTLAASAEIRGACTHTLDDVAFSIAGQAVYGAAVVHTLDDAGFSAGALTSVNAVGDLVPEALLESEATAPVSGELAITLDGARMAWTQTGRPSTGFLLLAAGF